jgi:hypothetical protein
MERGFARIPAGTLINTDLFNLKNPRKSALRSIRVNPRAILTATSLLSFRL